MQIGSAGMQSTSFSYSSAFKIPTPLCGISQVNGRLCAFQEPVVRINVLKWRTRVIWGNRVHKTIDVWKQDSKMSQCTPTMVIVNTTVLSARAPGQQNSSAPPPGKTHRKPSKTQSARLYLTNVSTMVNHFSGGLMTGNGYLRRHMKSVS